ncbi:MAG: hypothetical protein ACI81I_000847, partial [Arcobacteraceae bacterium]
MKRIQYKFKITIAILLLSFINLEASSQWNMIDFINSQWNMIVPADGDYKKTGKVVFKKLRRPNSNERIAEYKVKINRKVYDHTGRNSNPNAYKNDGSTLYTFSSVSGTPKYSFDIEAWEDDNGDDTYNSSTGNWVRRWINPWGWWQKSYWKNKWESLNPDDFHSEWNNRYIYPTKGSENVTHTSNYTGKGWKIVLAYSWKYDTPKNTNFQIEQTNSYSTKITRNTNRDYKVTKTEYEVSKYSNFSSLFTNGTLSGSITIDKLKPNTKYYIRVKEG